tara:strand:- start:2718 stop:3113 length:396 start_codon:yes stop_codon:yes gene_type:complete
MASIHYRKWNDTPSLTNSFTLVTKLQNFGSNYSKKSILGYIFNLTDTASTDNYFFKIYYRTAEGGGWIYINTIRKNTGAFGPRRFKHIFGPIKNAVNFQLKIVGKTEGDISINDVTVMYRKVRDISESDLS